MPCCVVLHQFSADVTGALLSVHRACTQLARSLEQLHAEVREVLDQERLTASVNYQRLMCLLRTVLGGAPAKQRPQMNVSRLIDRLLGREAKEPQQEAPMDTPHRHLATAMKEMQDTVTYLETLNLSHEHTAIVNVTEVTRQNLLAVVQDVRDFVVRFGATLSRDVLCPV